MTIYWAGQEDLDFQNIGGATVQTANYRSSYARCALTVPGNQQTNVTGMVTYWQTGNIFSLGNFWQSARCQDTSYSEYCEANGTGFLIRWYDAAGLPRLQVAGIPGGSTTSLSGFNLQSINAAGTVTTLATNVGFPSNYIAKLDFQINYLSGFTMFIDGLPYLNYAGTLATDGNTTLSGFALGQSSQFGGNTGEGGGGSGYAYWSELVVSSTDTRSMSLQTLPPTGAGATSQWAGDANGDTVNAIDLNDSAGITSSTANQVELFTQAGTLTAPYVAAIVVSARAMTGATSPQNLSLVVHQSGTNYASPEQPLAGYFGAHQYVWNNDPSTGQPFANVTTMQTGVQSLT